MPKISEDLKSERKKQIIKHAFGIFSEKGYTATTVDDIVAASNISKGGIYTYFKSKDEIFIAIAEDRFNDRHSLVKSLNQDISSKEKLIRYMDWIIEWVKDMSNILQLKFTFEFWSATSRNPIIKQLAMDRYDRISSDLLELLREGVDRGEFRKGADLEAICYIILSSTDGIGFFTGVMGIRPTDSVGENLKSMIINSLEKGEYK